MPRPTINEKFFSTWTDNMAYVLGIIFSDGCLIEHPRGYNYVNFTSKDGNLIEQIKVVMEAEHKICFKGRGHNTIPKYSVLQFRNPEIYQDLLKLGLTPRKSKTVRFPDVPDRYLSHFVRGFFDGDGSVCVWQEKRWQHTWNIRSVFACASLPFLEKLRLRLHIKAGLSVGSIWRGPTTRVHELRYSNDDSIHLYAYMYSGSPKLYLKRKKDKFEKFISLVAPKKQWMYEYSGSKLIPTRYFPDWDFSEDPAICNPR